MKKLRLIATGGTIACVPSERGLVPGLSAQDLAASLGKAAAGMDTVDLFNMDSSNIQPEEWCKIAVKTLRSSWDHDGIIITHGTDTMAYTASMLSFMLRGIQIPVVLTGSQYPLGARDSDGPANLRNAVLAASTLPGGIYVSFGEYVIKGCRAVKTRTTSINAFESINFPYIGRFSGGELTVFEGRGQDAQLAFSDKIEPRVALVKLIPGASPALIDAIAECGIRGAVVEAFGLGGVHNFRRDHAESIRRLISKGIPVILASQCLYESSSPDVYQVSEPLREAGVISAADMTTEAAVTKLMWVLGHTEDMGEVRRMMQKNLAGEISEAGA